MSKPAASTPAAKITEAPSAPAETAAPVDAPAKPRGRRRLVLAGIALLALAAAGSWGVRYWTVGRFLVSTDNAYVGADMAVVAPKVSGYVAEVAVSANTHVKAGDVLVRLDDADYRVAVQQAQARIETQDATIARLGKQVEAQAAAIDQAKAQIASAEAEEARASADYERTTKLAQSNFASRQSLDTARADSAKATAATIAAKAAGTAAMANLDVLKAQRREAEQTRKELEAALAKAQLDLDATLIRAPFAGIIGNKAVETGDYVSAGKRLAALVPDNAAYVDANFKETQLRRIRPGQSVEVVLDTDPDHPIAGKVESVAPAAGQVFSLLPPENATGNFTKIVQRVPVRIRVPADALESGRLRPGLSVEATIDTRADGADRTAQAH